MEDIHVRIRRGDPDCIDSSVWCGLRGREGGGEEECVCGQRERGGRKMSAELQPSLRVDPKVLLQRLQQCVSTSTWQQYCALLNGFVNGKVRR